MPTKLKRHSAPAAVAGKNGHSLISSEKFRQLYAALLKCELLEERLSRLPAEKANGSPSLVPAAVGMTLDLEREDTIVHTPQTFAASLVKGVPAEVLLHHLNNGKSSGGAFAYIESGVLIPTFASPGVPAGLAAGMALANKMAKNRKIAVAFIEGDASVLKECKDAFELSSAYKLPVLYVIQARLDRSDVKLVANLGKLFPVIAVDAHDPVAIYRVAQESVSRARDGGPSLIVCIPNAAKLVTANAVRSMEQYLAGKKLFQNSWKDEIVVRFNSELGAACLPESDPLA